MPFSASKTAFSHKKKPCPHILLADYIYFCSLDVVTVLNIRSQLDEISRNKKEITSSMTKSYLLINLAGASYKDMEIRIGPGIWLKNC
jgi:hypothetical protein